MSTWVLQQGRKYFHCSQKSWGARRINQGREALKRCLLKQQTNSPDYRRCVSLPPPGAEGEGTADLSSPELRLQGLCRHRPGADKTPGAKAKAGGGRGGEMKTAPDLRRPGSASCRCSAHCFLENIYFLFRLSRVCFPSPMFLAGCARPHPPPRARWNPPAA